MHGHLRAPRRVLQHPRGVGAVCGGAREVAHKVWYSTGAGDQSLARYRTQAKNGHASVVRVLIETRADMNQRPRPSIAVWHCVVSIVASWPCSDKWGGHT
jgi:hypothetical protein